MENPEFEQRGGLVHEWTLLAAFSNSLLPFHQVDIDVPDGDPMPPTFFPESRTTVHWTGQLFYQDGT